MLIGLPAGQNRGSGGRADRLSVASGEEKALIGRASNLARRIQQPPEIRHVSQLNPWPPRVIELGGINSPVIQNE